MGQEHAHPAGHEGRRGHRKPHGLPPHRRRPEEGRGTQLRHPQEPARIRRGDGRAAQAGLRLPPEHPRRRQLQAVDPGHDRPADRAATSTSSWPRTTAPRRSPSGPASSWRSSSTPATSAASISTRPSAWPRDEAERMAEGQVLDAMEENLPEEEDQREWNWEALAKLVNTRWQLEPPRPRPEARSAATQVGEFLIEKAREAIEQDRPERGRARSSSPISACARPAAGCTTSSASTLDPDEVARARRRGLQAAGPREGRRRPTTRRKPSIPVLAGLSHFTTRDASGHKRVRPRGAGGLGPRSGSTSSWTSRT